VDTVSDFLSNPEIWRNTENDTFDFIIEAMDHANKQVFSAAKKDNEMAGMGTTMIVSVLTGNKLYIGHVGDSRLYLIRDSEIRQVTCDHSLVEALVKEGSISKEDAKNHPSKNIITRVIGTNESPNADTFAVDLEPDDIFLMCTDGLTNKLDDDEINNVIVEYDDLNKASSRLVEFANDRGGEDNITVILISLKG
jgi:PPM family protein phosphatase